MNNQRPNWTFELSATIRKFADREFFFVGSNLFVDPAIEVVPEITIRCRWEDRYEVAEALMG